MQNATTVIVMESVTGNTFAVNPANCYAIQNPDGGPFSISLYVCKDRESAQGGYSYLFDGEGNRIQGRHMPHPATIAIEPADVAALLQNSGNRVAQVKGFDGERKGLFAGESNDSMYSLHHKKQISLLSTEDIEAAHSGQLLRPETANAPTKQAYAIAAKVTN